jgi:peptidyl-prolyl cis-trans isomerase C
MKKHLQHLTLLSFLFILSAQVIAADIKLGQDVAAKVNEVPIMQSAVDEIVKDNVARGQKDSPALRKTIIDSLVNRQLIIQDSMKQGFDKSPQNKKRIEEIKNNFLINLAVQDYLSKHPVTDTNLKTEYDLAVKNAQKNTDLQQYKISHIVVATPELAKDILDKIKKGDSFTELAKQYSVIKGKNGDGTMDWVLPNQIVPEISNVMVNLTKGGFTAAPIQTSTGWHIIKLDDKQAYKIPSFEDSKQGMRNMLTQKRQAEYIESLKKTAKIQTSN